MIRSLVDELRQTARALLQQRVLLFAGAISLGLGIAAAVCVYAFTRAAFDAPLPYAAPEQLAQFSFRRHATTGEWTFWAPWSAAMEILRREREVGRVALVANGHVVLDSPDGSTFVDGATATSGLSAVLGVPPTLGRWFLPEDEALGADPVVVIGHRLWFERFGGDTAVIGQRLVIDGVARRLVGVMPPHFDYVMAQLWTPMPAPHSSEVDPCCAMVAARLREGISMAQASHAVNSIVSSLAATRPTPQAGAARAVPIRDLFLFRPLVPLRNAATLVALLVLVLGVVNLVGLLLVRGLARRQEIAVRAALGARRGRLARLLLLEGFLVAIGGGVVGTALAAAVLSIVRGSFALPSWLPIELDAGALVFAWLTASVAGLAAALLPALRASRASLRETIDADSGASSTASHQRRTAERFLVALQVALAIGLVVTSAVVVQGALLERADGLGFRPDSLVVARVYPGSASSGEVSHREALARLSAAPGSIASATAQSTVLLTTDAIGVAGRPREGGVVGFERAPRVGSVSADYFRVLGIPILAGRTFTNAEQDAAAAVAVIDAAAAERFFGTTSPIGRILSVRLPQGPDEALTVIGVVGNVNGLPALLETAPPHVYSPRLRPANEAFDFYVRANGTAETVVPAVRAALRSVLPVGAVMEVQPAQALLSSQLGLVRTSTYVFAGLSLIGLVTAATGIFSIVAFTATSRTREIGIRTALGAPSRAIAWLVVREAVAVALVGTIVGAGLGSALLSVLRALNFRVGALDIGGVVAAASVAVSIVAIGVALPVLRATRVDPTDAMRST
ncbi:MAG TPA: ABC transporter permease [Gemmatimonadaceae bacterium]|nr:ABC transporter permease [Gemmatimonadaceae bacterium]